MGTAVRGKRGTEGKARIVFRFRVGATFRDKARAVEHWMKEKRDATPFPSDEELHLIPARKASPMAPVVTSLETGCRKTGFPVNTPAPFAASPDTVLADAYGTDAKKRLLKLTR